MEVMMLVYIEVIHVDLIRAGDEATKVRLLCHLQCQNHDQNINSVLGVCTLAVPMMIQSNPLMLTKSLVGWLEHVLIHPNTQKVSVNFSKILAPLVPVVRLALVCRL